MGWAVLVCSGQYWYTLGSTDTAQSIPVPKPNRYCPEHTGTAQSIPVLSRAYQYCPGVSSFRHHHQANTLSILNVLAKTPCIYEVPELRYSCHCCRRPCRCPPPRHRPPPRRRPPPHHHHHHHLGS